MLILNFSRRGSERGPGRLRRSTGGRRSGGRSRRRSGPATGIKCLVAFIPKDETAWSEPPGLRFEHFRYRERWPKIVGPHMPKPLRMRYTINEFRSFVVEWSNGWMDGRSWWTVWTSRLTLGYPVWRLGANLRLVPKEIEEFDHDPPRQQTASGLDNRGKNKSSVSCSEIQIINEKFGIQDSGFRIQSILTDEEFRIQDSGFSVLPTKTLGFRIQDSRFRIQFFSKMQTY